MRATPIPYSVCATSSILRYNLKTVRAYLLKEEFQLLWDYVSPNLGRQVLG